MGLATGFLFATFQNIGQFFQYSGHPGHSFKAFKRHKVFQRFQLLRSFELVNKNVFVKVPPLFASTERRKTFLGIKLVKLLHLAPMISKIKLECLSLANLLRPSLIFTGKVRGGFVEHISWTLGAKQTITKIISFPFVNLELELSTSLCSASRT